MVLGLSTLSFAAQAGMFVFPVGDPHQAPAESSYLPNGFHISQSFNTSILYGDGGADYGWCLLGGKDDTSYKNLNDCQNNSGKWKYGHTGDDLADGSDRGTVVAIADGYIQDAKSSYGEWGNVVLIKHIMPTGTVVYSLYGHLLDDPTSLLGRDVKVGDQIGRVGSTGGSTNPHLHLTIVNALLPPLPFTIGNIAGYLSSDPADKFRYYYDPLLAIDDRNHATSFNLILFSWTEFSLPATSPSSSAYIEYQGIKYDLAKAADKGYIDTQIWGYENGVWSSFSNLRCIIFKKDKTYRIQARVSGATLTVFQPGNHYPDARARQDMLFASFTASLK